MVRLVPQAQPALMAQLVPTALRVPQARLELRVQLELRA
jgi:hypothetical protein